MNGLPPHMSETVTNSQILLLQTNHQYLLGLTSVNTRLWLLLFNIPVLITVMKGIIKLSYTIFEKIYKYIFLITELNNGKMVTRGGRLLLR